MGRTADEHAALVLELQDEYLADDLVPPEEAASWDEQTLREWFESGGVEAEVSDKLSELLLATPEGTPASRLESCDED